ncbi:hypothetical protein BGZ83_008539 [Gryganskiella cystojenkinii]|nr:hypothetical protein BGZ83_008539 [Gryganskiella cystojenkinii]
MKARFIVASLALTSIVLAQTQQVLDTTDARPLTAKERAAIDRELPRAISVAHFKAAFLSTREPFQEGDGKFEAYDFTIGGAIGEILEKDKGGKCFNAMSILSTMFEAFVKATDNMDVPVVQQLAKVIVAVPKTGFRISEDSVATSIQSALHGLILGLHAVEEAVKYPLSYVFPMVPEQALRVLFGQMEGALDNAVACFNTAGKMEAQFSVATCGVYADVYRGTVEEVASRPVTVASDAAEDLKRVIAGAQAILDISKSAVSTSNEDLLNVRPIFLGKVLNQYREEVNRLATTDDIKNYAQIMLSSVIASSNALEACLSVAADADEAYEAFEVDEDEEEDEEEDEDF